MEYESWSIFTLARRLKRFSKYQNGGKFFVRIYKCFLFFLDVLHANFRRYLISFFYKKKNFADYTP